MILAKLANLTHQMRASGYLQRAVDFLVDPANQGLPDGRYEIEGEKVFALVQSFETIPAQTGIQFEAHRRYIDIQYVTNGCERMDWIPLDQVQVTLPYDPARDFCEGIDARGQAVSVIVAAGEAAVFFPEDAHAPKLAVDQPEPVRKIVIKLVVEP
jgi:biofilm protein TabA